MSLANGLAAASIVLVCSGNGVWAETDAERRACSLYGAGFRPIPGTDTCIQIDGSVQADINHRRQIMPRPFVPASASRWSYNAETRMAIGWDVRSPTEYGTLRAFTRVIARERTSTDDPVGAPPAPRENFELTRAFMQFGGLTLGRTQSFFVFYANALNYTLLQGGGHYHSGLNVAAATAWLGDGLSATLSVEQARDPSFNDGNFSVGAGLSSDREPDLVGAIRLDQPWGAAQIAGAVRRHQLRPGPTIHSYAVSGGAMFRLPWMQGDEIWLQATYSRGLSQYLGLDAGVRDDGPAGQIFQLSVPDGVTLPGNRIALTPGWSVLAAFQHYWTPALRTSVFGHYTRLDYGNLFDPSSAAFWYCVLGQGPNCDPNFAFWQAGIRNVWSPAPGIDFGLELLYTRFQRNKDPFLQQPFSDTEIVSGLFRIQRRFGS